MKLILIVLLLLCGCGEREPIKIKPSALIGKWTINTDGVMALKKMGLKNL